MRSGPCRSTGQGRRAAPAGARASSPPLGRQPHPAVPELARVSPVEPFGEAPEYDGCGDNQWHQKPPAARNCGRNYGPAAQIGQMRRGR